MVIFRETKKKYFIVDTLEINLPTHEFIFVKKQPNLTHSFCPIIISYNIVHRYKRHLINMSFRYDSY